MSQVSPTERKKEKSRFLTASSSILANSIKSTDSMTENMSFFALVDVLPFVNPLHIYKRGNTVVCPCICLLLLYQGGQKACGFHSLFMASWIILIKFLRDCQGCFSKC